MRGGVGSDVLLGGSGNDLVDGNSSADVAELGSGNDRFQWDPGDGSDTVEGQAGTDAVDFNGSNIGEVLELSAYFGRAAASPATSPTSPWTATTSRPSRVRALGGADTVTVGDLSGTAVQTADVDLSANGGGGDAAADTVIANGTRRRRRGAGLALRRSGPGHRAWRPTTRVTGSEAALDALRVQTLAGDDEVTIASNLNDLIGLAFDLGADD